MKRSKADLPDAPHSPKSVGSRQQLSRLHFAVGWIGLFVAVFAGVAIDAMLGLKIGLYLDVENQTRRLMWRLAHAHAAGVSLVHVAFGAYLAASSGILTFSLSLASRLSTVALVALPTGFALGGAQLYGDEPGLGIFLTPVGGVALTLAIGCVAYDSVAQLSTRDQAPQRSVGSEIRK